MKMISRGQNLNIHKLPIETQCLLSPSRTENFTSYLFSSPFGQACTIQTRGVEQDKVLFILQTKGWKLVHSVSKAVIWVVFVATDTGCPILQLTSSNVTVPTCATWTLDVSCFRKTLYQAESINLLYNLTCTSHSLHGFYPLRNSQKAILTQYLIEFLHMLQSINISL